MPPRLFIPPRDIPAGSDHLRLSGAAHRHVVRVLRLRRGDRLVLFDGVGTEIEATIENASEDLLDLSLGARTQRVAARCSITLLAAVTKGDRMEWTIQKTTELGVAMIVPVLAARAVVRLEPENREPKRRRWQTIAQEAARQCERADVPSIARPMSLAEALDSCAGKKLLLRERVAGQPLLQAVGPDEAAVTLLVGPEGGFTDEEAKLALACGFEGVSLGSRILRAETAAMVAVALVQAATGGLD